MTTLLVANRGEIALRILRTARRMGLHTVAVYSDADVDAPFVRAANRAVRIGPPPAADSYLRVDRIVDAARETGAELVHPGYGFLAEDPRLARACEDAGLRFVGPPSSALEAMGDKGRAKAIAAEAGAPVLHGYAGDDQSDDALAKAAEGVGYPLLLKPAAGGGGKGMAVVRDPDDLSDALASARRVAQAAFGDDRLLLERYLERPRHVEVQVLADAHGRVIHLGERDCSAQRRHQKVLEETPSPAIDDELRERLHAAGVAIARGCGYRNAGTCEFLVGEDGTFGFIEMNARLQVEHPVTEAVTGLDLVELQLRVAMDEPLPLAQEDVTVDGHAVEVRVYAEDPASGFLPQAGRILHVRWPDGVRVDTGVAEGTAVPAQYDPLLAKLVVHAPDRPAALDELRRALGGTELLGVRTNLPFLAALAASPVLEKGEVTTDWLEGAGLEDARPETGEAAVAVAAAAEARRILEPGSAEPWSTLGPWRVGGDGATWIVLRPGGEERTIEVRGRGPYEVDGRAVEATNDPHGWTVDDEPAAAVRDAGAWLVWLGAQHEIPVGSAPRRLEEADVARLGAPMPGQVIAVRVEPGDEVTRGQELVVVEAMKMEHAVKAPADGTVTKLLRGVGDQVERDEPLVDFEPRSG